ncbi:MAG: ABC transporter ATP-binding protein [Alphaproteobacteria bacterium]|nr:ABC transporter ATP-binding protein [Alphaproteobacteria bacterium]
MATLEIADLRKRFGTIEVLKGIDITLEKGGFLVLVGPSGCGKSTLLNTIAGLEQISSGEIRIGGTTVNHLHPSKRDIAMVFQSYALYPNMSVAENIGFGMEMRGVPKAERDKAIAAVATTLQIEHLLARRPSQLSGGQRQRVAMGRALVRRPSIFLFDEPLSNLDAKLRVDMRIEIKRLHQTTGSTIVYVTHDQIEAMTMASRIAVMNHGEVQQFAEPDVIYNRPANLFVARFMGSPPMNTVPARLEGVGGSLAAVIGAGTAEELRLPLVQPAAGAAALVGREVVLGIRPECIAEPQRRFGDEAPLTVEAPVEMTEPTGAETIVLMRLGGQSVLGRVAPDMRPPIGGTARFAVDIRKICLFDPATEGLVA